MLNVNKQTTKSPTFTATAKLNVGLRPATTKLKVRTMTRTDNHITVVSVADDPIEAAHGATAHALAAFNIQRDRDRQAAARAEYLASTKKKYR